ncbi:MAG: 50S ribosomal protein L4 [Actinomycetota bacterium]|nr:50S ribosomal protein L4 [Actinomycetota bacterium]
MAALHAPTIGGKGGKVRLDQTVFGESFRPSLVHECVRAELAARRRGTASTRRRNEVAMTGAKAWRQKGTGRARTGPLSTPQRTGGGVAFGPKPRSYTVKVNRRARRKALRAALSLHAGRSSLAIVDAGAFDTPRTSAAAEALAGFSSGGAAAPSEWAALVIVADGEDACARSFRNLAGVSLAHVNEVGVADIVGAGRLLLSRSALDRLTEVAQPPSRRSSEATVSPAGQEAAAGDGDGAE